MERSSSRRNAPRLAAGAVLLALAAVACGGGSTLDLADVAVSARDVPADWVPADLSEEELAPFWDLLPELLTTDANARLLVRGIQSEAGLQGVSTLLIQTDEPRALPADIASEQSLGTLSRLLIQQEALLGPPVLGGDPGAYFSGTDTPLPGSVRSRLVRLLDSGYLFSDSVIFTKGPVLAVVTVWYPDVDEPVRDVYELASEVERRLRVYLDQS